MAEITVNYSNWDERQAKVAEYEGLGYILLHDDYAADWKTGEEPRGTLTFTDVIPAPAPIAWQGSVLFEEQDTSSWEPPNTPPLKGCMLFLRNSVLGAIRIYRCSDGVSWVGVSAMELSS